jgi:hypothetical protein
MPKHQPLAELLYLIWRTDSDPESLPPDQLSRFERLAAYFERRELELAADLTKSRWRKNFNEKHISRLKDA